LFVFVFHFAAFFFLPARQSFVTWAWFKLSNRF
jgi:hypothetical protein